MSERVGRKRKTSAAATTTIFEQLHKPTKVKEMLSAGADANEFDEDGCSALYLAASMGHAKTIGHLITHGAQVSGISSPDECTALYGASIHGQVESVRTLLRNGAIVDVPCQDGSTAVSYLCFLFGSLTYFPHRCFFSIFFNTASCCNSFG